MKNLFSFFLLSLLFIQNIFPQTDSLRRKISEIISSYDAVTGIAVINLSTNDTLTINGNEKFPMQSVYKFPLALAVLNQVDNGKFSLDEKILIKKSDLLENTWSPLRDKYPRGNIYLTPDELLTYTVSQSDNNACDILFRLMGGTGEVHKYIHSLGIKDISIAATEEEMHRDWDTQFTNWCKPYAMALLFKNFREGKILSEKLNNYLWDKLVDTPTGLKRIKGLLPDGTIVAHKTGTFFTNEEGITSAINDAGIIILRDGNEIVIVVFVSNSREDFDTNEKIIAEVSKAVWDFYSK